MAFGWALLLQRHAARRCASAATACSEMADAGVQINLMLMALNLLPILPLDGGRIAVSLLPHSLAASYSRSSSRTASCVVILLCSRPALLGRADAADPALGVSAWLPVAGRLHRRAITEDRMFADRVLSGMRPTGRMHIGHYHGALKNWVRLQEEYECLYFAADWHALTTHYETPERIEDSVWEMFVDWLAVGHQSDARDDLHPVARARARRARAAARHDRAGRLARARADVQGPAGKARRPRSVDLRLPRLSGDAGAPTS